MKNCISASPDQAPIVPNKRVSYAFGMVLGVADFEQEQAHFEWKSRLANHLTDGSGTLCGIQLEQAKTSDGDVEIRLHPGYAISPKGHWLWVENTLCAHLGAWIKKHKDPKVDGAPSDFTKPVSIYVQLCYNECPTDAVPIAANACASADDSSAPSRMLETVSADFSWQPPDQTDNINIRAFAELLAHITIVPKGGKDESNAFFEAVRSVAQSHAAGVLAKVPGPFHIPERTLRSVIHEGLSIWATEVRQIIGQVKDNKSKVVPECMPAETGDDCLLIGRLLFTWDGAIVVGAKVEIHQKDSPVLLDNKVLQEWLAALQANTLKVTDEAQGDVIGKFSDLTVVGLQKHPISQTAPTSEQALVWDGANWTPQTAAGDATGPYNNLKVERIQNVPLPTGVPGVGQVLVGDGQKWVLGDHGNIAGLGDDDHTQYLRTDGTRALTGAWNVGNSKKITGLIKPTANGDAVRFDEAVLDGDPAFDASKIPTDPLRGDLGGTYPFPTVARIQKRNVLDKDPDDGQALVWSKANQQWEPATITQPPPVIDIKAILAEVERIPVLGLATISVQRNTNTAVLLPSFFRIWFHLAPGLNNNLGLSKPQDGSLEILAETGTSPVFLTSPIATLPNPDPNDRNVWNVPIADKLAALVKETTMLRFIFHLDKIDAFDTNGNSRTLISMMNNHQVHWLGFDAKNQTATVFYDIKAAGTLG